MVIAGKPSWGPASECLEIFFMKRLLPGRFKLTGRFHNLLRVLLSRGVSLRAAYLIYVCGMLW